MSDINNNKRIAKNTMMLYIRMLFSMVVFTTDYYSIFYR